MKRKLSLILGGLLLLGQTAWATPFNFTVSATVPSATGISVTVSSVNSNNNQFTAQPGGTTTLSFDPMTLNTTTGIYLPDHYFALDFGTSGGAGTADLTLTYTEGSNPNGATNGLGYKATATFVKEVPNTNGGNTESLLSEGKMRLIDLNGTHIPYTQVQPGFPRVYLGVWTGSTTGIAPDPTNGQPFTNGDSPGKYTGSLLVTAVVN